MSSEQDIARGDRAWLALFHAGDSAAMEACYRDYYHKVDQACGRVLRGADKETVVHDVFVALIAKRSMRERFAGGDLGAWLHTVAHNRALDFVRKRARERSLASAVTDSQPAGADPEREAQRAEYKRLIADFRSHHLPAKWAAVFEVRFLEQLSQREASARLGMRRTTLAYQEKRVLGLLRRYLLHGDR